MRLKQEGSHLRATAPQSLSPRQSRGSLFKSKIASSAANSGLLANAARILALPLLAFVLFYQKTLSPDHGMLKPWFPYGYCKFYPSCSEYTATVLRQDGILGLPKIIKRLISCRPGVAPSVDQP